MTITCMEHIYILYVTNIFLTVLCISEPIGGPGGEVGINELKFGKRKYRRGW